MVLRAAAPAEQAPLVRAEVSEPAAGPRQVLVEVEACGVCRTDLHIVEGEVAARLPVVPGHQAAGRVLAVGQDVKEFAPGDRVGVGWLAWTCGSCAYCTTDRENLCERARFTGRDVDGGYAARLAADARFVFPLPVGLSAGEAAPLLCAGIIGYRSLRLSGISRGGRLGMFGFGASAHLAAQVARYWGCEVYAFTREEHHRELARELGAAWAGAVDSDPGVLLDAAVIFAPAGEIVPAALALVRPGGIVAINAIHMSDLPSMRYDLLYRERSLIGVTNFTRRDAREFLQLAGEVPITAQTELFTLGQANEALLRLKRGAVHGAAVLTIERDDT
jgi:propanol-preferring alcohol dehydrogenase